MFAEQPRQDEASYQFQQAGLHKQIRAQDALRRQYSFFNTPVEHSSIAGTGARANHRFPLGMLPTFGYAPPQRQCTETPAELRGPVLGATTVASIAQMQHARLRTQPAFSYEDRTQPEAAE